MWTVRACLCMSIYMSKYVCIYISMVKYRQSKLVTRAAGAAPIQQRIVSYCCTISNSTKEGNRTWPKPFFDHYFTVFLAIYYFLFSICYFLFTICRQLVGCQLFCYQNFYYCNCSRRSVLLIRLDIQTFMSYTFSTFLTFLHVFSTIRVQYISF